MKTVNDEAIDVAIDAIWSSHQTTCDNVDFLGNLNASVNLSFCTSRGLLRLNFNRTLEMDDVLFKNKKMF